MLDPKILRDEQVKIRSMLKARAVEFDLDGLVNANEKRKAHMNETDELRRKKNHIGQQIADQKKSGGDASVLVDEMRQVDAQLAKAEKTGQTFAEAYERLARTIPNLLDESVPVGADESANVELRRWGDIPESGRDIKTHVALSEERGWVDLKRAAKVSGARFYYLRGELVRLNQALISYALDFVAKKGYTPVQPPYMIKRKAMEGAIIAEDFEDVIYGVQDEDLYMIGTSEHAMAAMHMDEILDGKGLPLRYAGTSPCFRKEAGAHGLDQKGIFRVHQFDKIEQFVFARPEESKAEHDKMLAVSEEFYRSLEIPYRVMLLSSGDMGKVSAKTYDIEGWMAGQNAYRELVSCSNCLDFQARRLMVRFRDSTDAQTQYVHTLNSTLVATSRTLVAIMENFQDSDGMVRVPKPLQSYVGADRI